MSQPTESKTTANMLDYSYVVYVCSYLVLADNDDMFRLRHDALVRPNKYVFCEARHSVGGEQPVVLFHTERLSLRSVSRPVYGQRASANRSATRENYTKRHSGGRSDRIKSKRHSLKRKGTTIPKKIIIILALMVDHVRPCWLHNFNCAVTLSVRPYVCLYVYCAVHLTLDGSIVTTYQ